MLTPALVVMAFIAFYPLGQTVYDSFTDRQFLAGLEPTRWVGLENYRELIDDTIFRDAVVVTVKFTVITVSIELLLGMIIALVVNSGFKGRGVMRAVMLVPWAIPTVVAAQMWKWMYDDVFGVVNDSFIRLNIIDRPVAWISEQPLAAVAAVDIWKTTPFVALLLLAGLQVIPSELYEAADVDGASKWHQFWRITLPLLVPAILVTLIFRTLDALRVFDVFYVFFGARADTQTMAIYNQNTIVAFGDVGYGAAISVGIFLIIGLFVVIYATLHAGAAAMTAVAGARASGTLARRQLVKRKRRERRGLKRVARRIPFYVLIGAIFVYALFPFYWALRSAFTKENELFKTPVEYIPRNPTTENFRERLHERLLHARAPELDDRGRRSHADRARPGRPGRATRSGDSISAAARRCST